MLTALRTERVRLFNSVSHLQVQIRHVSLNTAISRGKLQGERSGRGRNRWQGRGSRTSSQRWKEDRDTGRYGDRGFDRGRFGDRDGDRSRSGGGFGGRYQDRDRGDREWSSRDAEGYGGGFRDRGRGRDGDRDDAQFGRRERDGDRFHDREGDRAGHGHRERGGDRFQNRDRDGAGYGRQDRDGERGGGSSRYDREIANRMRTDRLRWKPGVNEAGEDVSKYGGSMKKSGKSITRKTVGYGTIPRHEAEMSPWDRALRNKGLNRSRPPPPRNYQSSEDTWDYTSNADYQPGDGRVRHKFGLVGPSSIPYTHAAAEFIYGTSAVQAAIQCGRRKLYTLYIYDDGVNKHISQTLWEDPLMKRLHKLALIAGARVRLVKGTWEKTMNLMSGGRPHNNVILEASPLPKLPGISLQRVESPTATHITIDLAKQPPEEAEVNGTDGRIQRAAHKSGRLDSARATGTGTSKSSRYPLTVLLDGILDPGNLGGIIRSAHYLGVDAIAFSPKNSASLTPVTLKASAGAAESVPLITIQDTQSFITRSQDNGWRFFAAEAPGSASQKGRLGTGKPDVKPSFVPSQLAAELSKSPCVVMLGSEGSGLSKKLTAMADAFVAVPGVYSGVAGADSAGVDSLNVSVASALLCEAFLREEGVNPLQSRINAEINAAPVLDEEGENEDQDDNKVF